MAAIRAPEKIGQKCLSSAGSNQCQDTVAKPHKMGFLLEANENNPLACFETDRLYLHSSIVSLKFTKKLYKEIHMVCILLVPWEVLHVAKVLTNRHSANTFLTSGDYKKELKCRLKSHDIHFVPTLGAASRHLESFKDVCHSLILGKS